MWKRSTVKDIRAPASESAGNRPSQYLNHRATSRLYSLAGIDAGLQEPERSAALALAGLFARPRSRGGLERLLRLFLGEPVRVQPWRGKWVEVMQEDSKRRLTWDVQGRCRAVIGPLGWERFQRLLPGGADHSPLLRLARAYTGAEVEVEIALVLRGGDIPVSAWDAAGALLGESFFVGPKTIERDAVVILDEKRSSLWHPS
jgi:predicted component of type VI protein secretion system